MSTKIHALVDALGNPLGFFLTPGQAHDLEGADALLPEMRPIPCWPTKPSMPTSASSNRLLAAGKDRPSSRPRATARSNAPFRQRAYKARHLIENFFCKLKQFRAIATRYDKTARNFLAAIHLAAAIIWLN